MKKASILLKCYHCNNKDTYQINWIDPTLFSTSPESTNSQYCNICKKMFTIRLQHLQKNKVKFLKNIYLEIPVVDYFNQEEVTTEIILDKPTLTLLLDD